MIPHIFPFSYVDSHRSMAVQLGGGGAHNHHSGRGPRPRPHAAASSASNPHHHHQAPRGSSYRASVSAAAGRGGFGAPSEFGESFLGLNSPAMSAEALGLPEDIDDAMYLKQAEHLMKRGILGPAEVYLDNAMKLNPASKVRVVFVFREYF